MANLKTHFQQVPLEIVKKIVEEQIVKETKSGQHAGIKKKRTKNALSGSQKQLLVLPLAFAQVES